MEKTYNGWYRISTYIPKELKSLLKNIAKGDAWKNGAEVGGGVSSLIRELIKEALIARGYQLEDFERMEGAEPTKVDFTGSVFTFGKLI